MWVKVTKGVYVNFDKVSQLKFADDTTLRLSYDDGEHSTHDVTKEDRERILDILELLNKKENMIQILDCTWKAKQAVNDKLNLFKF